MKVNVPVQSQVDLSHLGESCRRSVNRTLYGNTDSAEVSRKVRSSGWALIQCDWCPCEKGKFGHRDRHAQKEGNVKTHREDRKVKAEDGVETGCDVAPFL